MKKLIIILTCLFLSSFCAFADISFDFGAGSGYVFYGEKNTKHILKNFNHKSQFIVCGEAELSFPIADSAYLSIGADSILDGRWKGGNHIYLWDYSANAGFDIYPGLGGLRCSAAYCLGRRTDFIDLPDVEDEIRSTSFGNGFSFGAAYDFGWKRKGTSPLLAASWRCMPRGGGRDNIVELKLKFVTRR